MKKNYFMVPLLLLIAPFCSNAQVVNGSFENVKTNFLPSNWGMNFVQQAVIDNGTGQMTGDQIQFTWCVPSMVYASMEAKTGQYAMEVSNAYNWTTEKVIPGMATIFNDPEQDSPGWNPGVPVNPSTSILLLGFDYKFFPAGNDVAEATLEVMDAEGNELGKASLDISGLHNTYAYVYAPISVTRAGTPAYMYISFNMAKEGSVPTFGTRLIVDNVIVNFSTLLTNENAENSAKVFPTLADRELHIIPNGFSDTISYRIINTEGKVVKQNVVRQEASYQYTMDVSELSAGIYFLNIQDQTHNSTKKFIKK
ncbi:T9SS type A sorting domain-containing protein [Flavobacterium sp. 25HG05S-40]|uniref:T9SS type A sorting domain-containing protein n=1 Tax=Flavobacterium sp. 25HG05S-40 TaxID=3458682 RepID=UPI0040448AEB